MEEPDEMEEDEDPCWTPAFLIGLIVFCKQLLQGALKGRLTLIHGSNFGQGCFEGWAHWAGEGLPRFSRSSPRP